MSREWYAVVYTMKRSGQLFVGKMMKGFLVDEIGAVDFFNVLCLKSKLRSSTVLNDSPLHLPNMCLLNLAVAI